MTQENQTAWQRFEPVHLENVLALNFCFEVESRRLLTSDILVEISNELNLFGQSASFYGVGNFGFRMVDHFSPLGSDGNYEGQWNDPANDHDIITVTNANFEQFKQAVNTAINTVKGRYGNSQSEKYFHWAKLIDPKWNESNFNIPRYCSVRYQRMDNEPQTQMEVHWLENKKSWNTELLSKYAPWYSTKIGFPIVNISIPNSELNCGIWQPKIKEINKRKRHEVRISNPDTFGSETRDSLQAVRIVFGIIQASIAARQFAYFSDETKITLSQGIQKASRELSEIQRQNAVSRIKTIIYRSGCLEKELTHDCVVNNYKNPFGGHGTTQEIIIKLLDEIGWGKAVLGKTVREFLS